MKNKHHSIILLVLFVLESSLVLAGESEDNSRSWEKYAAHKYSNLNAHLNGELTPVFRSLGDFGDLNEYFYQNLNTKKHEAFSQFLVQSFSDAMHGDVIEAMFADVLLSVTPPRVVLAAVAPHIGKGGRLEGILDGRNSDVAKHIQRQPQQGNIGPPNFIEYIRYLDGGKVRGFASQVNAEVIVDHMFKVDPQEAFISMLWADYGFNPYARGNSYPFSREDAQAVRKLQLVYAEISDALYRIRYSFPTRDNQVAQVQSYLIELADHEKWWVRLYVASLITREHRFRQPEIINKLNEDRNEHIKVVMHQLAEAMAADN